MLEGTASGGAIQEDYDHYNIHYTVGEFGLHGDENEMPPLDDPRWQSKIEKELLAFHFNPAPLSSLGLT